MLQIQFKGAERFDGWATTSFQSLNHQLAAALFKSSMNKQHSKSVSSSASVKPSSIFLQPDDDERDPPAVSMKISSKSLCNLRPRNPHQNAVGILCGASFLSTLIFLEKLVWWSRKDDAEEDSVPFIACSDPSIKRDILVDSPDPLIIENLRRKRVFLEEGGAGCIVMPCHLSHVWFNEISTGCPLPFFNVGECVARELKEAKLKPFHARSNVRVGVVATDSVLMAGFYQDHLENQGFEVVVPDRATMEHIVTPAIEALERKDTEGARNLLRIAIQMLLVREVSVVVVASDELQALLPRDDPLLNRCLDPVDALARSTVRWAKSARGY